MVKDLELEVQPSEALIVEEDHSLSAPATAMVAMAQREIEAAVLLARRFPRNEDDCFQRLIRTCRRTSFAAKAEYSFPRAGKTIHGPSIYFAREAAKIWGNLRVVVSNVEDTEDSRTIRAQAWDLETNYSVSHEDTFKKLIQRKVDGVTQWVVPDERDLRELTNRRAAILKRGCILELLPEDVRTDALAEASATRQKDTAQDPDRARKEVIVGFDSINVPASELDEFLGGSLSQASPAQITSLREIFVAIRDGHTTWQEQIDLAQRARLAKDADASGGADLPGARAKKQS